MKKNIKKLALIIFSLNSSFKISSSLLVEDSIEFDNQLMKAKYEANEIKKKRQRQREAAQAEKQNNQLIFVGGFSVLISLFLLPQNNTENLDKNKKFEENIVPENLLNLEQNVPLNFKRKVFSEKEIRELYKPANKCKFIKEITDFGFNDFFKEDDLKFFKYYGNMNQFDHVSSLYLDKFIVDNKNLLSDKYKNNNYILNYINYYVSTYDVNNNFDIAFNNQLNVIKLLIDDIKKDENDSNNFVIDFKKTIVLNAFEDQLNLFNLNQENKINNNNEDVYINYLNEDYKEDLYKYIESLKLSNKQVNSLITKEDNILFLTDTSGLVFQNFKQSSVYEKMKKILNDKKIQNVKLSQFSNLYIREQSDIVLQFNTLLNHRNCQEKHYQQLFDLFTESKLDNVKEILLKHKEFFSPIIKNNYSYLDKNHKLIFQTILIELIKKLKGKQNLTLLKPLIESIIINFTGIMKFRDSDIQNLSLKDMESIGISDALLNHFELLNIHNNIYIQRPKNINNKEISNKNIKSFFEKLQKKNNKKLLQDSIARISTYLTESSSHIEETTFINILDGDLKKDIETLVKNFQSNNVKEITNLLENIIINIRNSIINVNLINNKKQNNKYQQMLINKNAVSNNNLNTDINELIDLLIEHNKILDTRLDGDILEKNLTEEIKISFLKINSTITKDFFQEELLSQSEKVKTRQGKTVIDRTDAEENHRIINDILNKCCKFNIITKEISDNIITKIKSSISYASNNPAEHDKESLLYNTTNFEKYFLKTLSKEQLELFKEKVIIDSDNNNINIINQNFFNEYYNEKKKKIKRRHSQLEEIFTKVVYSELIGKQENHQQSLEKHNDKKGIKLDIFDSEGNIKKKQQSMEELQEIFKKARGKE